MKRGTKLKIFGLAIAIIFLMSMAQMWFAYGASPINMSVTGTNISQVFYDDLTGDTFLGETITFGYFTYDWTTGINIGEMKIHTAEKGMLTVKLENGTYNDAIRTFSIKKFTVTYPVNYPYTLTFDEVVGSYDSSAFTAVIVGRYADKDSSPEEDDGEDCEDCCTLTYTNDSNNKIIHVEARGDKDISSVGVLFYAVGGGSQSVNMNRLSNRLYFVDFSYGETPVSSFTASISFNDGTSTTEYRTVSSSSSGSGWGTWTGGSTTSDYTTALNLAKAKGFTTVMELVNDLNNSVKGKQSSITLLQDQLRAKNTEYESLKLTSEQYQRDSASWKSQYEQKSAQYNDLNTKYNSLLQGGQQTSEPVKPITEMNIKKEYVVVPIVAVILLLLWKKGKLKLPQRKRKFDPHEYNEEVNKHNGISQQGNGRNNHEQEQYIVREDPTAKRDKLWARMQELEKEYQNLSNDVGIVEEKPSED
jgi:hypothetical protein